MERTGGRIPQPYLPGSICRITATLHRRCAQCPTSDSEGRRKAEPAERGTHVRPDSLSKWCCLLECLRFKSHATSSRQIPEHCQTAIWHYSGPFRWRNDQPYRSSDDFHPAERSGTAVYQSPPELYISAATAEYSDGRSTEYSCRQPVQHRNDLRSCPDTASGRCFATTCRLCQYGSKHHEEPGTT